MFLAIHTDDYASRAYCRWETLTAKKARSPILVAHLLTVGEARTFPYSGNTPTRVIRATSDGAEGEEDLTIPNQRREIELLLIGLLSETLRMLVFTYDVAIAAAARRETDARAAMPRTLARPPELADIAEIHPKREELAQRGVALVYPDPPLDASEAEMVRTLAAPLEVATLSEYRSGGHGTASVALRGRLVGVAAGDPSGPSELQRLGFHVFARQSSAIDQALAQAVTVVAQLGGRVGYGGRLVDGTFTDVLLREAADAYHVFSLGRTMFDHYLAWANWRKLDPQTGRPLVDAQALVDHVSRLKHVGRVQLFVADGSLLTLEWDDDTAEGAVLLASAIEGDALPLAGRYRGAAALERLYAAVPASDADERSLTEMRKRMAAHEDARVVFGGKTSGYAGASPGVAEEALATYSRGKLLLVCGAFGGAAHDIAVALGLRAPLFARDPADQGPGYEDVFRRLRAVREPYLQDLRKRGIPEETWATLATNDNPTVLAEHLRVALRTLA